jgi:hypothetical protein
MNAEGKIVIDLLLLLIIVLVWLRWQRERPRLSCAEFSERRAVGS